MNQFPETADVFSATVKVWTPWGVQQVGRPSGIAAGRAPLAHPRGTDELPSVPDFADRAWPLA